MNDNLKFVDVHESCKNVNVDINVVYDDGVTGLESTGLESLSRHIKLSMHGLSNLSMMNKVILD